MSRFLLTLGSLLAVMSSSIAAPDKSMPKVATLKAAFGYITDSDGVRQSVKGLEFPFTIEKVDSAKVGRIKLGSKKPIPHRTKGLSLIDPVSKSLLFASNLAGLATMLPVAYFDATVYMADSNTIYGIFEEDNPSALDDIQMVGGSGTPWKHLTFGFNLSSVPTKFLVRWRCYANKITGGGSSSSAFNQEFADFGVYIPSTQIPGGQPGTYKLTINVQASSAIATSDSIWVASQFREPRANPLLEDGEGPFDTRVANVFNNSAPPTVGTSDNSFYYDWDPLDGTYTEAEVEQVNDGLSNLLFGIVTGGTLDVRSPSSVTVPQGQLLTAPEDSIDLVIDSDNTYLRVLPVYNVARGMPPLQIIIQGTAANIAATSLTFKAEVAASIGGGSQSISLYNYNTSAWEIVDTRPISSTDAVILCSVNSNPTRFINQTSRQIRSKIEFFPPLDVTRGWEVKLDQAQWQIIRP